MRTILLASVFLAACTSTQHVRPEVARSMAAQPDVETIELDDESTFEVKDAPLITTRAEPEIHFNSKSESYAIEGHRLRSVTRRDHWKGALQGVAVGALGGGMVGAVAGLASGDDPSYDNSFDEALDPFRMSAGEKAVAGGMLGA